MYTEVRSCSPTGCKLIIIFDRVSYLDLRMYFFNKIICEEEVFEHIVTMLLFPIRPATAQHSVNGVKIVKILPSILD